MHVLGLAVDHALAIGKDLVGELGRDNDLVAMLAQDLTNQLLVVTHAIDVGAIEEIEAEIDRTLKRSGGFGVIARTIELRHSHTSETQFRDHQPLAAELALFHLGPPSGIQSVRGGYMVLLFRTLKPT